MTAEELFTMLSCLMQNNLLYARIVGSDPGLLTVQHTAGVSTIWSLHSHLLILKTSGGWQRRCPMSPVVERLFVGACRSVYLQQQGIGVLKRSGNEKREREKGWERHGEERKENGFREMKCVSKCIKKDTKEHQTSTDSKEIQKKQRKREDRTPSSFNLIQLTHSLQSAHRAEPPLVCPAFISQHGL